MIGTSHRPLLKFNQNAKKAFTKYCKSSQTLVQMNVALSSSRQWSGICELNMWKFYYTLQSPLRFYGFFDKFLIQNRPLTVNQSTEWGMLIKKWFFLVSLNQRKKKNCKAVFLRPHSKNDALIFQTLSFFKNVRILRMRLFFFVIFTAQKLSSVLAASSDAHLGMSFFTLENELLFVRCTKR